MDGQQFYTSFRYHFDPKNTEEVHEAFKPGAKTLKASEWNSLMSLVLSRVMKSGDFHIHAPESVVIRDGGRGRIDHKWMKGDEVAMIEHENNISGVQHEISNLLNSDSRLKILITYSSDQDKRVALRQSLNEQLKEKKGQIPFEFLLMIGRDSQMNRYDDWEAFSYKPEYIETELTSSTLH